MVLEQFIIDADIIWDQVGKTFFENPEAKAGRIMRVQVVNAGVVEDLTGYTLNLGWTSVRDPSKFGLDAFDAVDITKGIFEIDYTSEMLTNVGPLNAALQLVPPGEGRTVESNNFKLTVKNSAINAEAIQGENSFSALETALVEVNGWNARIDEVEQEFKDRADALDGAYPVRLTAAEQLSSVAATKADAAALKADAMASGSPKGVYATLSALQSAFPTGTTGAYLVSADGIWYYWSGSAWTIGGLYQAPLGVASTLGASTTDVLSQQALTKELGLDFAISGFISSNGTYTADAGRSITDFIRCGIDSDITFKAESDNSYVNAISFYDRNKSYISGISNNLTPIAVQTILAINIPSATEYVRLSTKNSILSSSFVSFKNGIQGFVKSVDKKATKSIVDANFEIGKKLSTQYGKNLFNKSTITPNYYLTSSGNLSALANYFASDFIVVEPLAIYALTDIAYDNHASGAYYVYYNKEKVKVSSYMGNQIVDRKITIPMGCYYIRLCGLISALESAQFEKANVPTTYEAYTEYKPIGDIASKVPNRDVITVLPSKMYFVKDKQATIYYENVLLKNMSDPTTLYFSKGTNYNRQVAFKFTAATSNQSMTTQVVRSLKKGELKTINYDVIDPSVNVGKSTKMLFIGDSFTDNGIYVKETKALLNNAGVVVELLGTCGDGTFKAEGLSGGTLGNTFIDTSAGRGRIVDVSGVSVSPSTGYPGQTYRDQTGKDWTIRGSKIDGSGNGKMLVTKYQATEADFSSFPATGTLTKQSAGIGDAVINYSNPTAAYFNPFINGQTGLLDITNYITVWGLQTPEIVVLQFTWNDVAKWASDSAVDSLVNNFKLSVDHIHEAYPTAKVIISIEPCGSVNGNLEWNGKKYAVLRLVELLLTQFEVNTDYNTWVKIAPSYAFVDLVYGYSSATVTPSERYAVTEQSGGDGTHPNTAGMNQIADCIYPIAQHLLSTLA